MKRVFEILGVIALVAVIGFGFVGCGGGGGGVPPINVGDGGSELKFSGTITVPAGGIIMFSFDATSTSQGTDRCTFTTDLASPNDSFTLPGDVMSHKTISGLTAASTVTWSAKVTPIATWWGTYVKDESLVDTGMVMIAKEYK